MNFYHKPISMFVMVAFTTLLCFWANQSPAASSAPASEKKPAISLEKGGSDSTGFFEQEKSEPIVKKHEKFSWPLAVFGAVVLLYMIVVVSLRNYRPWGD